MRLPCPVPLAAVLAIVAAGSTGAQAPQQAASPPKAQAWIDVATFSGLGMPAGLGAMSGGGGPMAALGSLFGGGGAKNTFGQTHGLSPGRWVDVTLRGSGPTGEAQLQVPPGFLSPALALVAPQAAPATPVPEREPDDAVVEPHYERPRGKLLMYWGCGPTVRAGQPRVLDFATMSQADLGKFFVTRSATGRGAHSMPGRPLWPNPTDARMVPENASLAGAHQFGGGGVPDNFRFTLPAAQDLMPALALQQRVDGGATELSWNAAPSARAYFVAAMGAAGGSAGEMVLWTSSEQPETGFGLVDYQGNAAIDRWLREKILLAPATTSCTVPAGVFAGAGAMVRLIGYGSELNLAYPPRPADPRQRWDPDWALKVRVKTVTQGMLGMTAGAAPAATGNAEPTPTEPPPEQKKPNAIDLLRGILGR